MRKHYLFAFVAAALLGCTEDGSNAPNANNANNADANRTTVNRPPLDDETPPVPPSKPGVSGGNTPATSATGRDANADPGTTNPTTTNTPGARKDPAAPGASNTPSAFPLNPLGTPPNTTGDEPVRPDNTAVNQRDRDEKAVTPEEQGNNQKDIDTTAEIRRKILELSDLSVSARNVKIITNNGKVTLRGPVATKEERETIERIAHNVARKENVTSQLEVAP